MERLHQLSFAFAEEKPLLLNKALDGVRNAVEKYVNKNGSQDRKQTKENLQWQKRKQQKK